MNECAKIFGNAANVFSTSSCGLVAVTFRTESEVKLYGIISDAHDVFGGRI
jgi:hypothetical protein